MDGFNVLKRLGKGSFGVVYKVRRLADNKKYAIKKISLQRMHGKQIDDCLNEVRLLASLNHPNIVKFYEAFPEGKYRYNMNLCIVMEYARGGDLAKEIRRYKINRMSISERKIWNYILQISDAINFLHANGIMHRDIKAANCFLSKRGIIKIGDMNISKIVKNGELARTCIGTPYYMSPEIWRYQSYDTKCDVWSCGCLFYELAALKVPFEGFSQADLSRKICLGHYVKVPNRYYSHDLWRLIQSMLRVRQYVRPDMRKIYMTALDHAGSNCIVSIPQKAKLLKTIKMQPTVQKLTDRMPESKYNDIKKRRRSNENINRLPNINERWSSYKRKLFSANRA